MKLIRPSYLAPAPPAATLARYGTQTLRFPRRGAILPARTLDEDDPAASDALTYDIGEGLVLGELQVFDDGLPPDEPIGEATAIVRAHPPVAHVFNSLTKPMAMLLGVASSSPLVLSVNCTHPVLWRKPKIIDRPVRPRATLAPDKGRFQALPRMLENTRLASQFPHGPREQSDCPRDGRVLGIRAMYTIWRAMD